MTDKLLIVESDKKNDFEDIAKILAEYILGGKEKLCTSVFTAFDCEVNT